MSDLTRALHEQALRRGTDFDVLCKLIANGADPSAPFDEDIAEQVAENFYQLDPSWSPVADRSGKSAISGDTCPVEPLNFLGLMLASGAPMTADAFFAIWPMLNGRGGFQYKQGSPVLLMKALDAKSFMPWIEPTTAGDQVAVDWHSAAMLRKTLAATACMLSFTPSDPASQGSVAQRLMSVLDHVLSHGHFADRVRFVIEADKTRSSHCEALLVGQLMCALSSGIEMPETFFTQRFRVGFVGNVLDLPALRAFSVEHEPCGLHHAIAACHHSKHAAQAIAALRRQGVDVFEATERTGKTALHFAAAQGRLTFVSDLLEMGFDPLTQDAQGLTPMAYAMKSSTDEADQIAALLQACEAKRIIASIAASTQAKHDQSAI